MAAISASQNVSTSKFEFLKEAVPSCQGKDTWSHRVFVVSNENGTANTIDKLAKEKLSGNTIMGVSGFFALNVASVRGTLSGGEREIEHIVMFDVSKRTEAFWKQIKKIVCAFDERAKVIEQIKKILTENKDQYFYDESNTYKSEDSCNHYISRLDEEIQKKESWLSDDIKFERVRKIFEKGNFEFFRLDLTDPAGFDVLQKAFDKLSISIDSIYLSNVVEYLESNSETAACVQSMAGFIGPDTWVIDTEPRVCVDCEDLEQRVVMREENLLKDLFCIPPPQDCPFCD